ncbi:MAG: hypothetical protein ACRDY7_09730, partial [Acidimicrobiia bacterium]
MSTSAQVLSLGADLVVFLAGVSLLLVLMLRPDLLGASALGRTVLAGAATLLATTALVHGALVDRSSQDWIEGIRAVAIVLLGLGCMGVGARWPRTTLLGALAVLVVGQIAFREDGDQVGDLLRFLGGCGIGLSLWLAARRSLATRISAAAGVLLVAVVLVLSGILSTVLTDNVSEQAIERASDRARIEAGLIDEKRDEALSQADFIVNLFRFSEDGREAIRSQDAGRIGAFLQSLRTRYGQVDFLAYFDQDKNLVASATSEQTGATILIELSGSPTVEAAFVGGLSAAGGGVEPTSNNGLVALGVQLVEFENDTGAPTRYGAMAAGFFLGRDYLLGRLDQDEKGQVNLSVAPVRKPGAEGVANNLLATTFKPGLVPDASSLIDGPEGERLVDDVFSRGAAAEGDGTFSDDNIFYAVSPIPPVGSQSAGGAPPSAVLFVTVDGSVIDEARASLFRTLFLVALGAAAVALALAAAAGSRLGAP